MYFYSDTRPTVLLAVSWLFASTAGLLLWPSDSAVAEPPGNKPIGFFAEVSSFSTDFCVKCHGDKVQKNGINLTPFKTEKDLLKQRKLWREIVEQVKTDAMPPEDQKQPTKQQREQFVRWVTASLDEADRLDRLRPDPGRSVVRRLNRGEFNRTVSDLLGVEFSYSEAVGMPDDTVGEAFDNLAVALTVSESLMEKYFSAADLAIEKLYTTAPEKGHKRKPNEKPSAFEQIIFVEPDKNQSGRDLARQVAEKFVRRAYRRPVEPKEIDRLLKLYDGAVGKGVSYRDALKPVLKAALVSPNFLLRVEHDRGKDSETAYKISDHELAVRLSYFLSGSLPDAELAQLADEGKLSNPDVFDKQVLRLLSDPKSRALTDSFASQWLRLKKLPDARPSTEFFPTFTPKLRQAMAEEAFTFFDKLRLEDRSLLELLDANYTYLDEDLANHYGIRDVKGHEFRKVTLSEPNRGGLLGMAAMLTLTSHTNRTSPTLRGKYILEVVLGTPPPPPPPNVSQIDDSKKKGDAKTFRELLTQHATQAACASCHARIDPLGFGLENFDAIGRFRKSGLEIDASGKLPSGETFNGAKELKQVLLKRKDQYARNLTEKMFSFALGRELASTDSGTIQAIVDDLRAHDYHFSRLVLGIVKSYPFQHRRNLKADENIE